MYINNMDSLKRRMLTEKFVRKNKICNKPFLHVKNTCTSKRNKHCARKHTDKKMDVKHIRITAYGEELME